MYCGSVGPVSVALYYNGLAVPAPGPAASPAVCIDLPVSGLASPGPSQG